MSAPEDAIEAITGNSALTRASRPPRQGKRLLGDVHRDPRCGPPDQGGPHAGRPGRRNGPLLERRRRSEPARLRARRSRHRGDLQSGGWLADGHLLAVAAAFPFKDVDPFIEFIRISKPSASSALKMPLFLARHPGAIGTLKENLAVLKPPPSYAAITLRGACLPLARRRRRGPFRPLRLEAHGRAAASRAQERRKGWDATTCARSSKGASPRTRSDSSSRSRSPAPGTTRRSVERLAEDRERVVVGELEVGRERRGR